MERSETTQAGPTVLVVEDDPLIASFVTRALVASGFAVEWVATAGAGLQRLAAGDVAVAVLDLNLPDMDGLDLLRALRADHPFGRDLPVVIITARNDPADRDQARSLGVRTYLRKPFALGELLAAVRVAAGAETGS
ncbi:response regulator [Pseudonocardia sp.]|uniref:response regulator transcription factor n=1 Tax=Pseudonocardia sp. TaxID=60912 RepID=UPI002635BDAF|nr:response regulator [Pseudonocardia sp.]